MSGAVRLGHVGITVPDVDAAATWYSQVFGWPLLMGPVDVSSAQPGMAEQLRQVFGEGDVAFRQAHLALPGEVTLELFEFPAPRPEAGGLDFRRIGVSHLSVVVVEIERTAERIAAAGGTRRTEVLPIFPGEHFLFCYCGDPFGNAIELTTHPHSETFKGRTSYT
ncbi:MAG: VOC family protein [Actinobacteria bacterium]|nr:VOC family protein [Actinomycetota bacterium]